MAEQVRALGMVPMPAEARGDDERSFMHSLETRIFASYSNEYLVTTLERVPGRVVNRSDAPLC
jgi:hypothetical protein